MRPTANLARLGHVTRARVTQVMNRLNLAPDIQEAILILPSTQAGRDAVSERPIRCIVAILRWEQQRQTWRRMRDRI
jgi:hypothetical protein